jgi:hypothetical protein
MAISNRIVCVALLGSLLGSFPQELQAQTAPIDSQTAQFFKSRFNRDAVEERIRIYSRSMPGRCTQLQFSDKFTVFIFTPLKFSPDGRALVSGAWKEQVPVQACGIEKLYNIITTVRVDGALIRDAGLLGTTRASLVLQRDAVFYAAGLARTKAPAGCQMLDIADTQFVKFEGAAQAPPARDMRAWHENWTVQTCNVQTAVMMTFTPDATGTRIAATLGNAN